MFLLSIWRPSTVNSTQIFTERAKGTILAHPIINSTLEILDDDKLDKEWVIRNILGGMAAGFGLRGIYNLWRVRYSSADTFPSPYSCTRLSSFAHYGHYLVGVGS